MTPTTSADVHIVEVHEIDEMGVTFVLPENFIESQIAFPTSGTLTIPANDETTNEVTVDEVAIDTTVHEVTELTTTPSAISVVELGR